MSWIEDDEKKEEELKSSIYTRDLQVQSLSQRMEEDRRHFDSERRKDDRLLKQMKHDRILQSKIDKRLHALDLIIENIEPYYPKQKNIRIWYYDFNYLEIGTHTRLLEEFLKEAICSGAFSAFKISSESKVSFSFIDINLNKLKRFREKCCSRFGGVKEKDLEKIELPEDVKNWEDITIKIINNFDAEIWLDEKFYKKITYKDLGCYKSNTSQEDPDLQWSFLVELSVQRGELDLSQKENLRIKDRYQQYKIKLSKRLIDCFGLEDDPFYDYKERGKYETKFKLEPEPQLRGTGEIYGAEDYIMDGYMDEIDR